MKTYLLTWNPEKSSWENFSRDVLSVRAGRQAQVKRWSCGNSQSIRKGESFFFLKQGPVQPGIIGSGRITRGSYEAPHWDEPNRNAWYVGIRWDALVDPGVEPYLPTERLQTKELGSYHWKIYKSGTAVPEAILPKISRTWHQLLQSAKSVAMDFKQYDDELSGFEGEAKRQFVQHRRRENRLRIPKVYAFRAAHDGRLFCEVRGCAFDFEKSYGVLGSGYAQIHHLKPLSESNGQTTRLSDLAVVCANCHAMIHRAGACLGLYEISQKIRKARFSK